MEKENQFEKLTSPQNPKIKLASELLTSKGRKKHQLFVAEGLREMMIASQSGFSPKMIFFDANFALKKGLSKLDQFNISSDKIFETDMNIFRKIAYREDTEGIAGIFESKINKLSDLVLKKNPLIIVLESVEKPGNLGAILRTADAAAVDAVFVCDPIIDLFNPNVIRSSIGCIFSQKIVVCNSGEAIEWLKNNKVQIYSTALSAKKYYYEANFTDSSAIVMGTEANGLSEIWLKHCNEQIKIPMLGKIDSLNVSNATAIVIFEAMRQRNFK